MLSSHTRPRLARDQRGFTLIEVLVAMVTGIIVTGALFAILEISVRQSSRLSDVAQATRLGRTAMTHVVDELHSACLSPGFTPVQEKSSENVLIFRNAYSEKAEIPAVATASVGARQDEIIWDEAAKTLTDKTYLSTAGSWPNFTYSGTASPSTGMRIGEKISKAELENSKKEKETPPIFKYYAYATEPSTSASAPSSTLTEIPLAKGATLGEKAKTVASVLVNFRTSPTNGKTELGRAVDLNAQATFAFSAPSSEAKIEAAPCE